MCNQTSGLIARALEESGMSTVTVSLLREVTTKSRAPRALEVPYGFGFPLGRPNEPDLQHKILESLLNMVVHAEKSEEIWAFEEGE